MVGSTFACSDQEQLELGNPHHGLLFQKDIGFDDGNTFMPKCFLDLLLVLSGPLNLAVKVKFYHFVWLCDICA